MTWAYRNCFCIIIVDPDAGASNSSSCYLLYSSLKNISVQILRMLSSWPTFKLSRLLGSICRARAVNVEVIFAVINAMLMIPTSIHTTENTRAATDFGALSPYLMQKDKTSRFLNFKYQYMPHWGIVTWVTHCYKVTTVRAQIREQFSAINTTLRYMPRQRNPQI